MQEQYILTPIKNFVENAMKKKEFIPVDLTYPGFKVSKTQSVNWLANLVQTKVLINYNLGIYKSRQLSGLPEEHEFFDLLNADQEMEQKTRHKGNKLLYAVLEGTLIEDMSRDVNLVGEKKVQDLFKQAFVFGLSHHIKGVLLDMEYAKMGPANEFNPIDAKQKSSELAATLIYLKITNPATYQQLAKEIQHNPLKDSAKAVLSEINNPSHDTVHMLYNFDKKFTREHFPTQAFVLEDLDSKANRVMKKIG